MKALLFINLALLISCAYGKEKCTEVKSFDFDIGFTEENVTKCKDGEFFCVFNEDVCPMLGDCIPEGKINTSKFDNDKINTSKLEIIDKINFQ